ncbi:MAG TPA: M24 family metallopeptidase, partial [Syntrophorhabdaceae bacterium]|nr:M24 family metallopeptidase [Syntrophorhabdaceae bacterium]
DFGVCYHGYQVDETRMFAVGSMPDMFVKSYETCREIQDKVLDKVLEGLTSKELFHYSVELAKQKGYGDHYLGYKKHQVRFLAHGIGIEIGELPFIAASHTYPIEEGAVIAIEPKMVFPGKGACGIENTVHFSGGKYEVLTRIDENIIIV